MLTGAFTAMVTPFDQHGEIDWPGVAKLLAYNEASGMTGVVVAGSNGEGPSLSAVEKRDLVKCAVEHAGKLKIILGAGTCSLPEAVWLCGQAQKCGAIGALVLPPFYFNASPSGIETWFRSLLSSVELPVIVYNFPQSTRAELGAEMIAGLFDSFGNCIGVKDSSGSEQSMLDYLAVAAPRSRSVFVGNETLILKCLQNGGGGTISGLANSFPVLISRQVNEKSEALQALIGEGFANVKKHPQPAVHKAILDSRGLPGGPLRPPLEPLSLEAAAEVTAYAATFGF
ncbi:MAG: dihydrodipicolinate synthase family protein [Fimbriimonadales bacterium]